RADTRLRGVDEHVAATLLRSRERVLEVGRRVPDALADHAAIVVAHERALDGRGLAALRRRRSLDGLARARGGEAGTVERATQRATEGVGGATERERRVGRALLDDETRQRAQRGVDPAHDVDAAL